MNEADIQVLASIRRAELMGEFPDRESLENAAHRYWKYLEDWSESWQRLIDDGLIQGDKNGYSLTELGRPSAERYYVERPDFNWYYYQHFYAAAQASMAHTQFCERVYGKDLVQDGQADMDSIDDLIRYLKISDGDKVLDLGCGSGGVAEYLSDKTGAHVTGLDYAANAIKTAINRTRGKQDRVTFVQGDLNALDFPDRSFDAILSIDSIYWVSDIDRALASISSLIKPGGRIGIFISNTPSIDNAEGAYEPHGTWIAKSIANLGLNYDVHDYTESFQHFWPKLTKVMLELRDDFVAEENEVIFDSFMLAADENYLPAIELGLLRRFLYIARV
ncbi:MAG: methyltransferase domain-containing protein [Proteobacteria bacterium]|nr:methyltransferase domain-containing protein [Pseudomonadota bacterium]MDA1064081.1 methyltransferase domain-containing protein [Pseudomonadota bacterium]